MAKSLSANITTGKAGNSEPVYLIELALDSGVYFRWATKDTNNIASWSGSQFYGGRLHQLGTIEMEIDLRDGPGMHNTYSFEFTLLNHDSYHTTLQAYNLYNRSIEVRLIFGDGASASWANAVGCFKGIIYDWEWDDQYITFKCTSNDKKWMKELPEGVINLDDFPYAPEENLGKRRPLVYGSFADPDAVFQTGGDCVKGILVDKYNGIYLIMDHNSTSGRTCQALSWS